MPQSKKEKKALGGESGGVKKMEGKAKQPSKTDMAAAMEAMDDLQEGGVVKRVSKTGGSSGKSVYALIEFTKHASGEQGKNLIGKFTILAYEKDGLLNGAIEKDIPVTPHWYDKGSGENLIKVATPSIFRAVIENVRASCPESAKVMKANFDAPLAFEPPEVKMIVTRKLVIDGKPAEGKWAFFVGSLFAFKDVAKALFGWRYLDIEFGGKAKTAWCAPVTHELMDDENGVEPWFKNWGVDFTVLDLTGDESDASDDED